MILKRGITREVIVLGKLVFKIPSLRSYRLFLTGLLSNMQEVQWWKSTKDKRLCPVLFNLPLGLLVVMPYATPIKKVDYKLFKGLPVESKLNNFGRYRKKVVLIDYGS